jgi:predicted pyridoxine 5'-phosphate oxidase superfamily flavin-nucleotide-binding protein
VPEPASPFHAGELVLQAATGVSDEAARLGRAIATQIPSNAADFIGRQQVAILATTDTSARVVCSAVVGDAGAFEVVDPVTLAVDCSAGITGDALRDRTPEGAPIGLLFLEVATRRRYRVNGTVIAQDDTQLLIRVAEAYPNCPKYIQRRALQLTDKHAPFAEIREGIGLGPEEQQLVASADTFFVASAGPDGRLDASHRGGRPGFMRVDGDRIRIPDYAGNNMYNTLGNIAVNPAAGLLFIDFDTGDTLQVSGVAEIDLDALDDNTAGTNRAWTYTATSWRRSRLDARLHSTMLEMSPHNP